jgi:hypothetical protein
MRAALRLRARVLARRHLNPLDALLALGTIALAWVAGKEISGPPGLVANVALALLVAASAGLAHTLLYRARELTLLLAQPISARELVFVRFVELTAYALVAGSVLAALVGGMAGSGRGAPLAALSLAPLLAATGLLVAWALRRWIGLALVLPLVALATRSSAGPGELVLGLVRLEGGWWLFGGSALAVALALVLVPIGHGEAVNELAGRPTRRPILGFPRFLIPLPRTEAALVRRDFVLLLRGGFPRGALVLLSLPLGLAVYAEAARDRTLEAWQQELAALMTLGVLATVASFLFSIDFPRVRAPKQALERALPVRGGSVLVARTFEAAVPGVALALGLAAIAASGTTDAAERSTDIAIAGSLLAIFCAHHGACYGLTTETQGPQAELAVSAGFPIASGTLVVLASFLLTIHPWTALIYPLTYGRLSGQASRAWERAEA